MASNEEEVMKIAKKLDKMVAKKTTDNALDILKVLKSITISLETLQRTRIGMLVNNVRKQTSNEEVAVMAKQLIKGWKKLVSEPKKSEEKKLSDDTVDMKINSTNDDAATTATVTTEKANGSAEPTITTIEQCTTVMPTNDPVRDKCREMIVRGLQTNESAAVSPQRCAFLAAAVEEAIFAEFRGTGVKYKNRVRSRYSNLKDPKNSGLRGQVLSGMLKPEKLAKMTAEELASDELKKQREQFEEENIKDHQMAVNEGTRTDMFTCGRCKGQACTYNQLQTRSSDEPMTTFVFCMDCGNRWKFC